MSNIKNSIEKVSFSILNIIYFFIFTVSFVSFIFLNRSMVEFSLIFMVLSFICEILILGSIFWGVDRLYKKNIKFKVLIDQRERYLLGIFFLILSIAQIIVLLTSDSMINWDPRTIFDTAISPEFQPIFTEYFSYYPNNTVLVFSMRGIYNILNEIFVVDVTLFREILIIINILLVDVGIYFGYKVARRLFDRKIAYIYLFLVTLLFGFSPWLMVIYSDTLSIPFATAILYLILKVYDQKKILNKILLSVLAGIVLFLGYSIKPSVLIVIIAVGIIGFIIKLNNPKELLLNALMLIILMGIFLSCRFAWDSYIYDYQTKMELNEEIAFPWTYWVATGLHEPYGICNEEDQWATIYRGNSDRMYELHKEIIKDRLIEKGPIGYAEFLLGKMQWITSEGFFFWGEEISRENFADWESSDMNFFKELFYFDGRHNNLFYFYYQGMWGVILFALLIPVKKWSKGEMSQEKAVLLVRCILVGIILYILLLEGRPRYLIQYVPYFAMASAVGVDSLIGKIYFWRANEANNK